MKIVTILGSPRKRGNTAAVLAHFEQLAAPQHSVDRINIIDYKVNACLGCGRCQKVFDAPGCPQKDDALALFARMAKADLLVYASPLYCWDFTAQLKALIDRHFCLIKWDARPVISLMAGQRAALLVTCGDEIENNADLIQKVFEREMECCQSSVAGMYVLPDCSMHKRPGPRAQELAARMADTLLY